MLKQLLEKDLIFIADTQPATWQEAIEISCQKLIEQGLITNQYVQEIIHSVEEFGPYIVIIPEVAMPHANPNSSGVLGTAIAMTKFKDEVVFYDGENDEEKPAKLFFTLAAKDANAHLNNITQLMELLSEDDLLEALKKVETIEDIKKLI